MAVLERADQEAASEASEPPQALTKSVNAMVEISIVPPHILVTTSTTTGHSGTGFVVSSRTVSLKSGAAATSSSVSVEASGPTAGGVLAIVFIVIITLSVVSCVAGCIWRCCIQKGRKEGAAQANQQNARTHPQSFLQGRSQQYQTSDMPEEHIYGRSQNDIAMHDMADDTPPPRPGRHNTSRRFETIPEHEDGHDDDIVEQESFDGHQVQNSNVSPRKGYFYHRDAAGEHS